MSGLSKIAVLKAFSLPLHVIHLNQQDLNASILMLNHFSDGQGMFWMRTCSK